MTIVDWVFDLLLCGSLVWLASQVVAATDLFKSTVLFMVFGLVLAITWCRLGSADIGLAEAAIGAGLTGTMLLSTLATLSRPAAVEAGPAAEEEAGS